ncbi:MAG: acetate--CoA ligase family protein [Aquabacterium sp.]|uniref:acetate--CoA ligase family protein n=1 Tax=Aquabacterium sp. TaxID=1872578 RepID=UPI003BCA7D46
MPGQSEVGKRALTEAVTALRQAIEAPNTEPFDWLTHVRTISDALRGVAPISANTPRFLQAAFEAGIPVQSLGVEVYQFGFGRRGRWLDSTFTDATPNISTKIARHKQWAASLLKQAGLPVPQHSIARSASEAVQVATRLGYPVVVKPMDLDGGAGVAAGLDNEAEVRKAYEIAKAMSGNVLVEKHVHGRDFRLTVFNGELLWAVERVPGGVTGDGVHSIAALLDTLNADPRRGVGPAAPLKRLDWDDEAQALLDKAGLSKASIPKPGAFIRLRRTANVGTGGMPVAVLDQVHPDNAKLAIRAAQALQLDLAGIDLLIPDIGRSWFEIGGSICEVNAQPQLGAVTAPHLYAHILHELVEGQGRVPTVLVIGARTQDDLHLQLEQALSQAYPRLGYFDQRGVRLGGERLSPGIQTAYAAGKLLMLERAMDAMVLSIQDDSVLYTGLPLPRFDVAIIAGSNLRQSQPEHPQPMAKVMTEVLDAVLPACDHTVIVSDSCGISMARVQAPHYTVHVTTQARIVSMALAALTGVPAVSSPAADA